MQRSVTKTTEYLRVTKSTDNHDKTLSADEIRLAMKGKTDYAFCNEFLQFAGAEYKSANKLLEQKNRLDIDFVHDMQLLTEDQQNAIMVKTFYTLQKQFVDNTISRPGALSGVRMNMILPVVKTQQCEVVSLESGEGHVFFFAHNKASNAVKILSSSEYVADETGLIKSYRKYQPELVYDFEKEFPGSHSRHSQFNRRFGLHQFMRVHRYRFDQVNSENDIYMVNSGRSMHADVIERILQARFAQDVPAISEIAQLLSFSSMSNLDTDVTVIVSRVNNHAATMKNSLACCIYSGVETSMYSDLMRVMFLPVLKAQIHLELTRRKDITVSLENYLNTLEAAMKASDDPAGLFRNLMMAKWIREQLDARQTNTLFSPQNDDTELKRQLHLLNFQVDDVFEYYPESLLKDVSSNFPNFPLIKDRILAICQEIKTGSEVDQSLRLANRN
jgi:hypothetical protein